MSQQPRRMKLSELPIGQLFRLPREEGWKIVDTDVTSPNQNRVYAVPYTDGKLFSDRGYWVDVNTTVEPGEGRVLTSSVKRTKADRAKIAGLTQQEHDDWIEGAYGTGTIAAEDAEFEAKAQATLNQGE